MSGPSVAEAQEAANFLESGGPYAAIVCVAAVAAWLAWQWTKALKRERTWLLKFPEFAEAQRATIEGVTDSVEDLGRKQDAVALALGKVETRLEALR